MRRRRPEEGDNPAWPGLVDFFAFTLVLVLLLGVANITPSDCEKKLIKLQEENAKLRKQIQELEIKNKQLEEEIAKLRELIKDPIKRVIKEAREKLEDLFKHLKPKADTCGFDLKPNWDSLEITISRTSPICFDTGDYNLSPADMESLRCLASGLYELIQGKPFDLLINGTADPQPYRDENRVVLPRDNTDLSALRAATVAKLLQEAARGLGGYLRVVGLGVKDEVPLPADADPDEFYRKYRKVELVIKVNMEKLIQEYPSGPNK